MLEGLLLKHWEESFTGKATVIYFYVLHLLAGRFYNRQVVLFEDVLKQVNFD